MFDIRPATACAMAQLHNAMLAAFSDYLLPLRPSAQDFALMMHQRGLVLEHSRVAVVKNEVVAIWLVSVRGTQAYLISSGTRPEHRARGIAHAMALECITGLQSAGVQSFQTEVLRENETAAGLYDQLGFAKSRTLDCYVIPPPSDVLVVPDDIQECSWQDLRFSAAAIRSWVPTWQNADMSLSSIADHLTCFVSFDGTAPASYAVLNPDTGTVHQIAVRADKRRAGRATGLIRAVQNRVPDTALRLINVDARDVAFRALMHKVGAEEMMGQYELFRSLADD